MTGRPGARWYPRRGSAVAVQDPLFDLAIRPEARYYRQILDALTRSGFATRPPLEAELLVSKLFGTVWAGQAERDGAAEEAFGLGLAEFVRQRHDPDAEALLRTLAAIAPVRQLRAVPPPLPGRCWAFEDVYGDHVTVVCELAGVALVVLVDHARLSVAVDAMLTDDVETLIRDLTTDARTSEDVLTLRQVEPGWAGAVLARAFARTDLDHAAVTAGFRDLRALALARIEALPADWHPPPPPSFLPDFAAGPLATFFARYQPEPAVRVGPGRWEVFVESLRSVPPGLPALARSFNAWAVTHLNLPPRALAELDSVLDELLPLS